MENTHFLYVTLFPISINVYRNEGDTTEIKPEQNENHDGEEDDNILSTLKLRISKKVYPSRNIAIPRPKRHRESSTESGELNPYFKVEDDEDDNKDTNERQIGDIDRESSSSPLSSIKESSLPVYIPPSTTEHEAEHTKHAEQIEHDINLTTIDRGQIVTREIRLLLDAKRVGGLIGKGGAAITKIRQESQAKILIAKPIPHSLFRICSVDGKYLEITTAICLIIDKMAEESTRLPPYQITILVEEKNIGCLIGKKGNAITEIRHNTNANIYISSHLLRNSSEKTVDISGERNSVHSAIQMVMKRLCDNPTHAPTRLQYDPQMDFIPQNQVNIIANNALNTIKNQMMKSGVNVNVNKQAMNQNMNMSKSASPMANINNNNQLNKITAYPSPTNYYSQQVAANNGRLLNYALNRFGTISASVQPQIIPTASPKSLSSNKSAPISTNPTVPAKLISPIGGRLASAALLTPSLVNTSRSQSPFSTPTPIASLCILYIFIYSRIYIYIRILCIFNPSYIVYIIHSPFTFTSSYFNTPIFFFF